MYIATDIYSNKVFIENANNRTKYFCPICGQELIVKNTGTEKAHHFAHKGTADNCPDAWLKEGVYDNISQWHIDWQNCFPPENQEVIVSFDDVKHRADIIVDKTVIEFQHSPLSSSNFQKRTNFYRGCEYKVIWLFDFIDDYSEGKLYQKSGNLFCWDSPRRTFSILDYIPEMVEIFFQIKESENNQPCIFKIRKIEEEGFKKFSITKWFTKNDFLEYIGKNGDTFQVPSLKFSEQDIAFLNFKKEYSLLLNQQQERAIQRIDGVTLLLAVPGSGKTTTLISRIGYMVKCKGINPEDILALTYTRAAAKHMQEVFSEKFGVEIGEKVLFKTINSICYKIIQDFCKIAYIPVLTEKEQRDIILHLFENINKDSYPQEIDIMNTISLISYYKNLMISPPEVPEKIKGLKNFKKIFLAYQKELYYLKKLDFDDQLIKALDILINDKNLRLHYQNQFKYICVDEAQDTSKIQHEILKILCGKYNNLFLVGDEDQSIYGFRGAFPQALLDIQNVYKNPFVLKLETNYRSSEEIVNVANDFISKNKNHIKKDMISSRGPIKNINFFSSATRINQFSKLINSLKKCKTETAILYSKNDTAVALVDMLDRKDISYYLNNYKDTFFSNRVVRDIQCFFQFALSPNDMELLGKIYYKFCLYFNKRHYERTCKFSRYNKTNLLDEFVDQAEFYKKSECHNRDEIYDSSVDFYRIFSFLPKTTPTSAIEALIKLGYGKYIIEKDLSSQPLDLLLSIAKETKSISDFLDRLDYLEKLLNDKKQNKKNSNIILSTIHSAKGQEYNSVIIVDTIDGILPTIPSRKCNSKEKLIEYEEDRRRFYVAITRAKNSLTFVTLKNEDEEFIDEIKEYTENEKSEYEFDNIEEVNSQNNNKIYSIEPEYEIINPNEYQRVPIIKQVDNNNLNEISQSESSQSLSAVSTVVPVTNDFLKKWEILNSYTNIGTTIDNCLNYLLKGTPKERGEIFLFIEYDDFEDYKEVTYFIDNKEVLDLLTIVLGERIRFWPLLKGYS